MNQKTSKHFSKQTQMYTRIFNFFNHYFQKFILNTGLDKNSPKLDNWKTMALAVPTSETNIASVFLRFEDFLRTVGKMNLFDTLVYNYRLKESIPTDNILDVAEILVELITCLMELSDGLKATHKTLTKRNVDDGKTSEMSEKLIDSADSSTSMLAQGHDTQSPSSQESVSLLIEPTTISRIDDQLCKEGRRSRVNDSVEKTDFFCCDCCLYSFKSFDGFSSHQCVVTGKHTDGIEKMEAGSHFVQNNHTLQSLHKFICGLCLEEHRSFSSIAFHLKNCDGGPFFCELCPSSSPSYSTKKSLNLHKLSNHKTEKSFICSECGNSFKAKCSLQRHVLSAHERSHGPFKCEICEELFEKRILLTNHKLKYHALEREFLCQECGGRFSSKATLLAHLKQLHSETKRFVCQHCCKQFSRKDKLQIHVMVHTHERPFVCEICGKRLTRKSKLDNHIRLHLKEKFNCSEEMTSSKTLRSLGVNSSPEVGTNPEVRYGGADLIETSTEMTRRRQGNVRPASQDTNLLIAGTPSEQHELDAERILEFCPTLATIPDSLLSIQESHNFDISGSVMNYEEYYTNYEH